MKGLAKLPALKPMTEVMAVQPAYTLEEQIKREDDRFKGGAARVGEERAKRALDMLKNARMSETGARSTTLPELLAEAWLRDRGRDYLAQHDLGWARPDFVLLDTTPGVTVWRIQGTYWHSATVSKDAGQKERLLSYTVRGLPIMRVVDIWERHINDGDGVFDMAADGQEAGE
jgi:hypothetical protein